jgi:hypothetical protein
MLVIVLSSSDDGNGSRLWSRLAIGTVLAFLASQAVDRSTAAVPTEKAVLVDAVDVAAADGYAAG